MTDTTLQPATDEFRLDIRDGASDTERSDAKQSVEAMIGRARAAAGQIRSAEANPLEATDLLHDAETLAPADRPNLLEAVPGLPDTRSNVRTTHFAPPYDFQWAWHDGNGHPPFNSVLSRPTRPIGRWAGAQDRVERWMTVAVVPGPLEVVGRSEIVVRASKVRLQTLAEVRPVSGAECLGVVQEVGSLQRVLLRGPDPRAGGPGPSDPSPRRIAWRRCVRCPTRRRGCRAGSIRSRAGVSYRS